MNLTANPPLSLYVHLPWCEQKCPYCDFNSYPDTDFDEAAYIKRLIEDLEQELPLIWGRQISSIFIGGGTPSLFSGAAISQLLSDLRACLNLNPAIEITLEANPGSVDESRFEAYRKAGINRLSLGIQSFDDSMLHAIGRVHNSAQALSAYNRARKAGFDNINIDLMYGLPEQDLAQAVSDLSCAIELNPEHISHYQLTLEPNTLFHHEPPRNLPDDDLGWYMMQNCQSLLKQHGYEQYEISAYARNSHRSAHNLNYWHFGDYIGIGAGAHGKISLPAENRIIRRVRMRQPREYLQQTPQQLVSQQSQLSDQDLVFEFMLNVLRLVNGFDKSLFQQRCGLPFQTMQAAVDEAINLDLLSSQGTWLQPTEHGLQFHNDLQALFLRVVRQSPERGQIDPVTRFE